MRFGVVLCPSCRTAKGIVLKAKTATCPKCQRKWSLKNTNIVHKVDSESNLASVVGEYNMKLNDGEEIFLEDLRTSRKKKADAKQKFLEPQVLYDEIAGRMKDVRGKFEKLTIAAKELSLALGEFSQEEFAEVLKRAGYGTEKDHEKYLLWSLENDVIYEPKMGRYRYMED
jgi:hypothetical protein